MKNLQHRNLKNKHQTTSQFNWIVIGCWFGLLYWVIESIRDVFIFSRGSLIDRIFFPDPMSFWMRMLVVFILILFGTYAQSIKEKNHQEEQRDYHRIQKRVSFRFSLILTGLIFSISYWLIESIRMTFINEQSRFIDNIIIMDISEIWSRILAALIIILFSIDAQYKLNKQRLSEQMVREAEERLEQIISQMPYPMQICNSDGLVTKINHAFLTLFGFSSDENIIGEFNINSNPMMTKLGLKKHISKAFLGEIVFVPEVIIPVDCINDRGKTDALTYEVTIFPVFQKNKTLWRVVMIWKNISDHKKAEREKKEVQAQLLQSQKMEAVGILAGGIAHDFNNMLTAIIGSAEMAIMSIDEPDVVQSDLKDIKEAAERAGNLTRQLLLFSRKHPTGLAPVNLNQIIQNLLKMFNRLIGEDIKIITHLAPNLWTINGDAATLEQVLMNLVVNARDAMPQGGEIIIKTENLVLKKKTRIDTTNLEPGKYICLSIQDNGIGMERETVRHIFEPFYTTKKSGKGTGLGLSVVYGIIQQHNGWITVESKPNKGALFRIYFSAAEKKMKFLKVDPETQTTATGNNEKLLVVEDDDKVRQYTVRALERNGYQVFGAKDAMEAQAIFNNQNGNFHMLMCDVVLPGKTGINLAGEFQKHNPDLKVLMCSGYLDQKSQWPIIQEKGFRFLRKPYVLTDLLYAVQDTFSNNSLNA